MKTFTSLALLAAAASAIQIQSRAQASMPSADACNAVAALVAENGGCSALTWDAAFEKKAMDLPEAPANATFDEFKRAVWICASGTAADCDNSADEM